MSFGFNTVGGKEIWASFLFPPSEGVRIEELKIPLDDFCQMVVHFLVGGTLSRVGQRINQ